MKANTAEWRLLGGGRGGGEIIASPPSQLTPSWLTAPESAGYAACVAR